ncbi:hypothetical protein [Cryptosporangium phraense]|uniref:Uncharacterized protein n=1 Tax=Cryptosporangium phraense TaxID=2593070 RepID=A0A545AH63_9ACTN|nr:hypothetical protein [Cryptosporangium phraense]TQS40662.1 hypothetical protein FL583_33610 [Cryptosporangium phraense]
MDDEQRTAAEALAAVQSHQDRARRAARLPWWFYAAAFVLIAAGVASNDFVSLSGAKVLAGVIVVVLAVVMIARYASGTALLSQLRGVQPRSYDARAVMVVVIAGAVGGWLAARFGSGAAERLADDLGLHRFPYTVDGVLAGAFIVGVLALAQLVGAPHRPAR